MSTGAGPPKRRWLPLLLCIVVAALVWRFVDPRTTNIWIIAAITVPGILVVFALVIVFASPSLEVIDGVICARRSFGKTVEIPISQVVFVRGADEDAAGKRLLIRGLRDVEIVIDRRFDEDEIRSMLSELRATRPDLSIPAGISGV